MSKCPACGYDTGKLYDISAKINKLLKARNKGTIKYLNKIASEIIRNVPSEGRMTYFRFLFGIKDIDDNIVQWAIEQYFQSRHHLSGKGFAYLRSIMINRDKNVESIKKNERKRLGSTPPIINHEKETENG